VQAPPEPQREVRRLERQSPERAQRPPEERQKPWVPRQSGRQPAPQRQPGPPHESLKALES
jgi:hypothetical protein